MREHGRGTFPWCVIPAQAEIQNGEGDHGAWSLLPIQEHRSRHKAVWIPAYAGMTHRGTLRLQWYEYPWTPEKTTDERD